MRIEEIRPAGINRAYAEQDAASGACEELINMRLENGALRPTGDKALALYPDSGEPVVMRRIYIHRIAGENNYIGIYTDKGDSVVCTLSVEDGVYTYDETILEVPGDAEADIDIKFIGNLMVIRSGYDKKIYNFAYQSGSYIATPSELPDILLSAEKETIAAKTGTTESTSDYTSVELFEKYKNMQNVTAKDYLQDISAGLSFLRRSKGHYETEGFVGICANFTLRGGKETKPTAPRWYYLGGMPDIIYGNLSGNNEQRALHINMARGKLKVKIAALTKDGSAWSQSLYNEYKDYITGINIYCTYPKSLIDIEKSITGDQEPTVEEFVGKWVTYLKNSSSATVETRITPTKITNTVVTGQGPVISEANYSFEYNDVVKLGGELFYKQRTIELKDSLTDMQEEVQLDFSESMLTGDTMPVENSGYVERYGQIDVYNKRLHLFDTTNTLHEPAGGYFSQALAVGDYTPTGMTAFDVDVKVVAYTRTEGEDLVTVRSFQTKGYGTRESSRKYAWVSDVQTVYTESSAPVVGDDYYIYDSSDESFSIGGQIDDITQVGMITIEDTDYIREPSEDKSDYHGDGTLQYVALRSASAIVDTRTYRMDVYVKYSTSYFKMAVNLVSSSAYDYSLLAARKDRYFMFLHDIVPQNNTPESFEYALLDMSGAASTAAEWNAVTPALESNVYSETDIVTVSAQDSPTYFPPQNSYRVGGDIIGIAVDSQGISDVQIGQWPMDVFTDNGVYALELGSGEVFYGKVAKIADDIAAAGGMVSTPYGIAFLQGDGVYLLKGRRSTRISVGLDGYVDLDIRRCTQFKKAHGHLPLYAWYCEDVEVETLYSLSTNPAVGDTLYSESEEEESVFVPYATVKAVGQGTVTIEWEDDDWTYVRTAASDTEWVLIYDIFPYLLGEREATYEGELIPLSFREQMAEPENILIGYDNNREELWISDLRELFSYVYSFPEKSWHTVTETFSWYNVNYGIVDGYMYDITKESHSEETIRHIQSRPLKLGSDGYKCIERMIARINVNGPLQSTTVNENMFSMYVFGSRDMRNWYMIGAAQHEGYTQSLQINKTSSKFRAFIVTAGGFLTKGSEFSSVQAMIQDFYNTKLR